MSDPEKALGRSIGMPLMGELTVGEPDDVKELTDGARAGAGRSGAHRRARAGPYQGVGDVPDARDRRTSRPSSSRATCSSPAPSDAPTCPAATTAEMLESLARVCLPLDDSTVVLSGHGPQTTIGRSAPPTRICGRWPPASGAAPDAAPRRGM